MFFIISIFKDAPSFAFKDPVRAGTSAARTTPHRRHRSAIRGGDVDYAAIAARRAAKRAAGVKPRARKATRVARRDVQQLEQRAERHQR